LGALPGRLGTTLGMSASIDEYQQLQRELFRLLDRFVVLNETARHMLIADGAPAAKIVINRLGISQRGVVRKIGADQRPTQTPVKFAYVGRLDPTKGLLELASAVRAVPAHVPFELQVRGPLLSDEVRAFVTR